MKNVSRDKIPNVVVAIVSAVYLVLCFAGVFPCWFFNLTGLKCSACGGCHMVLALLNFNIQEAFRYNVFLFTTFIPFTLTWLLHKKKDFVVITYGILLLLWGVIRNVIGL